MSNNKVCLQGSMLIALDANSMLPFRNSPNLFVDLHEMSK